MDYQLLLAKYMAHVICKESVSFIDPYDSEVDITEEEHRSGFTREEWACLEELSARLYKLIPKQAGLEGYLTLVPMVPNAE